MNTGFNWNNAFDILTDLDLPAIDNLNRLTIRYRWDKNAENIDQLIDFNNKLVNKFKVVFTANLEKTDQENLDALSYLIDNNVEVIAVEAGNESYAKEIYNFDFELYKSKFIPIRDKIKSVYGNTIPVSVFLAPNPWLRNVHKDYNDAVKEYVLTAPIEDMVSIHIYYGYDELPSFYNFPQERIMDGSYQEDLDIYNKSLIIESNANDLFQTTLDYLNENFPGIKTCVTEFGISNTGEVNHTLGYNMIMWKVWNRFKDKFNILLQFNGPTPTDNGMITPPKNVDVQRTGNIKRLMYYTYELFQKSLDSKPFEESVNISTPGVYKYWYINDSEYDSTSYVINSNLCLTKCVTTYIQGEYFYSTSGAAPFMSKSSVKTYEIQGSKEETFNTNIFLPKKSFGIVELTIDSSTTQNIPPIANAGEDKTLTLKKGEEVAVFTFDGSASYDSDGLISNYSWSIVKADGTIITHDGVTLPLYLSEGKTTATLTVTDDKGALNSDVVIITVNPAPKKQSFWCRWFGIGCK